MTEVLPAAGRRYALDVPVLVVGAGACGLVAALAARGAGAEVLVLERDGAPAGSTALSSGFVPAAGTARQRALGIADSAALLASDMTRKAGGASDPAAVRRVAEASGPAVDWLEEAHGIAWTVLGDFLYPGHSRHRMHAVPERTGAALVARLAAAAARAGAEIATGATVTALFADEDGRVAGLRVARPDGAMEEVGCRALVLACGGYGGTPELVARHIPEMADALYFGHAGNKGDALAWGERLGAATRHLSAYQGHGSVATPHGVLVTWALMMEGGIQVDALGKRFSNEHEGYSEQAARVLARPGGIAWNVYDARLHRLGLDFEDYRTAHAMGAVREAESVEALARATGLPGDALARTLDEVARFQAGAAADPFGRDFTGKPALAPPFHAVKVTGALFHTQGGLVVDADARVLRPDGTKLPNLFAGGGAAAGVSGDGAAGYLSGNGLLTAITLGRLAGAAAARLAMGG